jgi:membrane protein implicated in regulation of membrane protease activity
MDPITIYLICVGVGLLFAVVSAFFAEAGGGHDGHGDTDAGHADLSIGSHEMPGFSAFSPTTIATFVTAFGAFGLVFSKIEATQSPWFSVPLAAICGLVIATLVVIVFNKIFRATQGSSEGRVAELFGQSATVITPIAAGGVGEIAYVQGGTRYTAAARAQDEREIPSGAKVRIVRVAGTQFFVTQE